MRILTLEVEILDPDHAYWIWENHKGVDDQSGVYVRVIREGKIPQEDEALDELVKQAQENGMGY